MSEDTPKAPLGDEFRRLADRSPDGMALLQDGAYVYANKAWSERLAVTSDQLVGRSFMDHVTLEDRETVREWLAETGGPQRRPVVEYRFVSDSGATVVMQLTRVRLSSEGQPVTIGIIGRDVTRLKQTQAQLLLADRMLSVGALAAGTAHEINNPLTYVQGNISFVLEEVRSLSERVSGYDFEELIEALEEAHEGAERVRVMVRRLHAFSKGDQEEYRPVDVVKVIEDAVNMAYTEIRYRARLMRELSSPSLVKGNESRLGQVVLNLLLNAAHALPEGRAEENYIRVHCRTDGDEVIIGVEDSGPGIPKEIVGRVFDAFFTTKPMGIGTGLGLSIAHSIVTDAGGQIEVASTLGQGTEFSVRLPAHQDDAEAKEPSGDLSEAPVPRASILVIDDEPLIAAALKRALREHDVHEAPNGRVAIEMLRDRQTFDVIFCDLMMPDLTGMDVYGWVSEHIPGLENRFVFMTGGIFTPRAQEFLDQVRSRNQSIEKPFDLERIRRFVQRRLRAMALKRDVGIDSATVRSGDDT
ncbi:MAG: ATP-binding protein [Myxococcota bacterium]